MKKNQRVQPGELIELVSPSKKTYILRAQPGEELQTHRGIVSFDDIIGKPWGSQVASHLGNAFFLLQPNLHDLIQELPRSTQIMYPKDIGYVIVKMGIGPGIRVIEAGTGSGSLTTALAWAVGQDGQVYSYENRDGIQSLAKKNLERVGLSENVTFKIGDISVGFEETEVDALFLDVSNSYDFIEQAQNALKAGGILGSILPTSNQVSRLLTALQRFDFSLIDVCELMLRHYKPAPTRLRPADRMVGHTGFLVFARYILPEEIDKNFKGEQTEKGNNVFESEEFPR